MPSLFINLVLPAATDMPSTLAITPLPLISSISVTRFLSIGFPYAFCRLLLMGWEEELGIQEVYSELLPADKVSRVEELLNQKSEKAKLAFVGDGINDAPVLSRADIGIAMGALGSDAAIEAADIVLMDDDPLKISKAIKIARKCIRIVY